MRASVRVFMVVCGVLLLYAPSALADGPGAGTPNVVTLGDSAISGEAGPVGRQHQPVRVARGRARLDRLLGHPERRGDQGLPPLQGRAGAHLRRDEQPEPRLLGRPHVHHGDGVGRRLQARHRLLLRRVRPQGPGALAAGVREHAQRARGQRDDRGQQLRLRRDRRALRDQLGDLAVLVEELLQRRLRHDVAVHRRPPDAGDQQRARRAAARPPGDDATPATARRSTRSSPRPTGRRSRAAPGSATPRPAGRGSRSAAAGCGTGTPTGPTTRSSRR